MNPEALLNAVGDIRADYILEAKRVPRRRPVLRALIAAALAVVCLSGLVCAMTAADVGPAYELLYQLAPEAAQRLKPVHRSDENRGIRVEVVSADVRGDTAEACIAVTDLTGDRVDGTLDLFDSCDIRTARDSIGHCERVSFDPETKTAVFLVTVQAMDGAPIRGGKMTFSVGQLLAKKQTWEGPLPVEASADAATVSETQVELRGGSYAPGANSSAVFLAPGAPLCEPTEGVAVTGLGEVDGQLHVQVYYEDIHRTDNHGWVWLLPQEGPRIMPLCSGAFWDEAHAGSYEDYVFDADASALEGAELRGEFTTSDTLIEGPWEITCPLETNAR